MHGHGRAHHKAKLENHFENHFVRFIQVLRHLGVRVSSAEAIDAINALKLVDFARRQEVKQALRSTLAKDVESQKLLEQAFDSYFVPREAKEERLEKRHQKEESRQENIRQAEEDLVFTNEGDSLGEEMQQPLDLTEEQKETYSNLPEGQKDKIKQFLENNIEGNPVNDPNDLMESVVQAQLNYWKRRMEEMQKEQKQNKKKDFEVELTGDEDFDEIIEHVAENYAQEEIMYEDMQNIKDRDIPKVALMIRKLSKKLATRISRRYRQSQKKKSIDIRRSIRHNIRYGGTMIEIKYKTQRIERPRIILLCDVSGSMARYASFLLQFTYGLSSVVENIESFVFAEDLERVTDHFTARTKDFDKTMSNIMNQSKEWGRATDLNTTLKTFTNNHKNLLTGNSIIIILSDAKTIGGNKVTASLSKLDNRVKDILWLNTLPKSEWSKVRYIKDFQRYCQMYECCTLAHLDKIMRNSLTRIAK